VTKTENTLYILQNLSSTDSEDYLESVEIEVYYGDDQGNEGMSTTYDMPAIADDAISTINELQKQIAELEKELSIVIAGLFSEDDLAIRDLEQQKEVIDILYKAGKCDADCLKYFKALKEQGK
jgi:hypothetical protein